MLKPSITLKLEKDNIGQWYLVLESNGKEQYRSNCGTSTSSETMAEIIETQAKRIVSNLNWAHLMGIAEQAI